MNMCYVQCNTLAMYTLFMRTNVIVASRVQGNI